MTADGRLASVSGHLAAMPGCGGWSRLGGAHAVVGQVQQCGQVGSVVGADADPDAGRDSDLPAMQGRWCCHGVGELLGDGDGLLAGRERVQSRENGEELVAAQTGEQVTATQPRSQTRRGENKQLAAGCMSEQVVDGLEALKVQEQQGQGTAAGPHIPERQLDLKSFSA